VHDYSAPGQDSEKNVRKEKQKMTRELAIKRNRINLLINTLVAGLVEVLGDTHILYFDSASTLVNDLTAISVDFLVKVCGAETLEALYDAIEEATGKIAKISRSQLPGVFNTLQEKEIEELNATLFDLARARDDIPAAWRKTLTLVVRRRFDETVVPQVQLDKLLDGLFGMLFYDEPEIHFQTIVDAGLIIQFGKRLDEDARSHIADLLWRILTNEVPYNQSEENLRGALHFVSDNLKHTDVKPDSLSLWQAIWTYSGLPAAFAALQTRAFMHISTLPVWIVLYVLLTRVLQDTLIYPAFVIFVPLHITCIYSYTIWHFLKRPLIRDVCDVLWQCIRYLLGLKAMFQILAVLGGLQAIYYFHPHFSITYPWVLLCAWIGIHPPFWLNAIGVIF